MQWKKVKSSTLKAVGYDRESRVLEVEFLGGGVYRYQEIPQYLYQKLMRSESVGQAFHKLVRPKYEAQCLVPNENAKPSQDKSSSEVPQSLLPCGHAFTDIVTQTNGTVICGACEQQNLSGPLRRIKRASLIRKASIRRSKK